MTPEKIDKVLQKVDATRRGVVKGMIYGTAFVVPLVASFTMNGLTPNQAVALSFTANGPPPPPP